MKILYFLAFIVLISCSETIEKNCFESEKEKPEYVEQKPFTVKEIIENKPDYLEIVNLKKYRSFKQDSLESRHRYDSDEILETKWKTYQKDYKIFKEKFSNQLIFSQLGHIGAGAHPDLQKGELPVGPSPVNVQSQSFTPEGFKDTVTPREMTVAEIHNTIQDYSFSHKQQVGKRLYALGTNNLGFWLLALRITNLPLIF